MKGERMPEPKLDLVVSAAITERATAYNRDVLEFLKGIELIETERNLDREEL